MKKISNILMILATLLVATLTTASSTVEDKMVKMTEVLPKPWYPPNAKRPETPEQRADRIKMIARITYEESRNSDEQGWYWSDNDLAWAAYVKMWFESGRFKYSVHTGKWRGDSGRSWCLGQIMNGGKSLAGTDEDKTRNCVKKVIEILIIHQRRCLNPKTKPAPWAMSSVYAGYGTGHSCNANTYMYLKDKNGHYVLDKKGRKIKSYWARRRGWMWWRMRSN